MADLLRMDLYRMWKSKSFRVCLILAFLFSLSSTPVERLLYTIARMISTDPIEPLPDTANLSLMIASPVPLLSCMLLYLSAVSFFHADMEGGFIKNIAGQMPKRGFCILSRFLAVVQHNLLFMAAGLIGSILGSLLFQRLTADDQLARAVLTFFLKLLLLQSICSILLLVSASFRAKSIGIVLAVLFGVSAVSLIYLGIDTGLHPVLNDYTFSIAPYMPDTLLSEPWPDTLTSVISASVTILVFLPLSIRVFDRRDVK